MLVLALMKTGARRVTFENGATPCFLSGYLRSDMGDTLFWRALLRIGHFLRKLTPGDLVCDYPTPLHYRIDH